MTDRQSISKKLRFEVFKRDKFTCQYCGRKAPDIILHVDHIQPVSKKGDNDITNLITSCFDCNMGKGNRELSSEATLEKKQKQLEELQERREQIEMMLEWQRGLLYLEDDQAGMAASFWDELAPGWTTNENGVQKISAWVKKYGFQEVLDVMKISAAQYLKRDPNKLDVVTNESWNIAFEKIPRICSARKSGTSDLYYIRGILRKRLRYINDTVSIGLLQRAARRGIDVEDLKKLALEADTWSEWREKMEWIIGARKSDNG